MVMLCRLAGESPSQKLLDSSHNFQSAGIPEQDDPIPTQNWHVSVFLECQLNDLIVIRSGYSIVHFHVFMLVGQSETLIIQLEYLMYTFCSNSSPFRLANSCRRSWSSKKRNCSDSICIRLSEATLCFSSSNRESRCLSLSKKERCGGGCWTRPSTTTDWLWVRRGVSFQNEFISMKDMCKLWETIQRFAVYS